jgi:hypothetical protein
MNVREAVRTSLTLIFQPNGASFDKDPQPATTVSLRIFQTSFPVCVFDRAVHRGMQ